MQVISIDRSRVSMMSHHRLATNAALVAGLAAALAAEGCVGAERPTSPSLVTCPAARVALCSDPVQAALVRAAVSDAADRIVPTLENVGARTALHGAMTELSAQLQAGDVGRARETLAAVEAALASARPAHGEGTLSSDAADLDAIAAAIHEAAAALADS